MTKVDRRRLLTRAAAGVSGCIAASLGETAAFRPRSVAAQGAFDVTAGTAGCSRLALIFNVGSGYEPATGILETLGAYDVPATTFVMGWIAEQNPALVQEIAAWGHVVGSHGYLPPELTVRSDDDVASDLIAASEALNWSLGYYPSPWFTPFASASDERVRSIANSLGLVTVGWSVGSNDWDPWASPSSIYDNVVGGAFDGAIVEMHLDAQQSVAGTAVALPWIIEVLSAQGYQFVSVPDMAWGC